MPSGPQKALSGTKAAISKVYTGSRAEQTINGATSIVFNRSDSEGIDRVAMIPGTAQAWQDKSATKERPCRPTKPINRSARKAARAM